MPDISHTFSQLVRTINQSVNQGKYVQRFLQGVDGGA